MDGVTLYRKVVAPVGRVAVYLRMVAPRWWVEWLYNIYLRVVAPRRWTEWPYIPGGGGP